MITFPPAQGPIDQQAIECLKPPAAYSTDGVDAPGPIAQAPPQTPAATHDATDAPDAADEESHPALTAMSKVLSRKAESSEQIQQRFDVELVVDRLSRNPFVVFREGGNPTTHRVGSSEVRALIAQELRRSGNRATQRAISEFVEELNAQALISGKLVDVFSRVAQLPDGTRVIALQDQANSQVWISPGRMEVVSAGSTVLFCRPSASAPMAMPAATGNCQLLKKYLNLCTVSFWLYIAWVTYTLATAKQPGNVFVILLLLGGQGTGKSMASKVSIRLIDPNVIGVSRLPASPKDLAVAAQHSHLLACDNLRELKHEMSDALCTMATGGSVTSRLLYSDDLQKVLQLHAALLLNGIHPFVDQPDLAQRCLPLRLTPMDESKRASEAALLAQFEADLPVIQRGLFDLIAGILQHLPNARVSNPQRMHSFCKWLAAMEMAQGHPEPGYYQDAYADLLNEGQLDSIRDNVVGSAVLDFAQQAKDGEWEGTPKQLLEALNTFMAFGFQRRPRAWPDNEIALSKRLAPQMAALKTQGVTVTFERRKERTIFIKFSGAAND